MAANAASFGRRNGYSASATPRRTPRKPPGWPYRARKAWNAAPEPSNASSAAETPYNGAAPSRERSKYAADAPERASAIEAERENDNAVSGDPP